MTAPESSPATSAPSASVSATPTAPAKRANGPRRSGQRGAANGGQNAKRGNAANRAAPRTPARATPSNPILAVLETSYPALFGQHPLPLKRGIFEDLHAAQPQLAVEELKQALGLHTRSNRYLQAVASLKARHDLNAQAVEAMAVEHSFHALTELFRRRQRRTEREEEAKRPALQEETAQWFQRRLAHLIEQSGLRASAFAEVAHTRDSNIQSLMQAVIHEATERAAKDEAMLRAYEAVGSNVAAFAEMYGLTVQEAGLMLARARLHAQKQEAAPAAPDAAGAASDA